MLTLVPGMTCGCRLCQLEAADEPRVRRKIATLVSRLKIMEPNFRKSRLKLDMALGIVAELERIRSADPDLSLVMTPCQTRISLCTALYRRKMNKELVIFSKKNFDAERAMNHCQCAFAAATSGIFGCLEVKDLDQAVEWAQEVKKYGVILFGSSTAPEAWGGGTLIREMSAAGINLTKVFGPNK